MGVSIGEDVVILQGNSPAMVGYDLITIGNGACLDRHACISSIIYTASADAGLSHQVSITSSGSTFQPGSHSTSSSEERRPYGTMTLKHTSLGKGSMLGARGLLGCGVNVPDEVLIDPCSGAGNPVPGDKYKGDPRDPDAVRTPCAQKPLPAGLALCVVLLCSLYISLVVHIPALGELGVFIHSWVSSSMAVLLCSPVVHC